MPHFCIVVTNVRGEPVIENVGERRALTSIRRIEEWLKLHEMNLTFHWVVHYT